MTLYQKVTLIIGVAIGGLFLIIYLLARLILLNSFASLEQDDTRRNLERAANALTEQLDYLSATTADWAFWDDTYRFVQDGNAEYISDNLMDEVFVNLGLNLALYTDDSGNIVFSKAFDLIGEQEVPRPAGLSEYLSPNGLLLLGTDDSSLRRGIVVLPDGPMVVAARPILPSNKQGPSRGTLIFGYKLDDTQIARLAESTRLSLVVAAWNDPHLSADFRTARASLSEQSPTTVRALNGDWVAGYTRLTDINGYPALILRADFPRPIYSQGQTTITYLMAVMLGLGLAGGIALLFLLEKTVMTEAKMGALLEHSSDVIILTHPDGTIKQVNPAFKQMFNDAARQFEGQSLPALFEPESTSLVMDNLRAVVGKGENRQIDLSLRNHAGNRVEVSTVLSPIWKGNGHTSGVLCSLRDITTRKRLENQLRMTLAQETELNALKSRLISIVSHELRTPLTTIQLVDEMLTAFGNQMTEERKQLKRELIKSEIQRMLGLLEDVLNLSRTESGKIELEPVLFNLATLCQTVIDTIRTATDHRCEFVLSGEDECFEVRMDRRLVQLMVNNLISNAAKYSPPGSTVYIELKCDGEESVIQIRDKGIGIPLEAQKNLFEPFFRADNVGTITGTGLGLTIVKQAVEAHQGTITYESQVGNGTTFALRLPNLAEMVRQNA